MADNGYRKRDVDAILGMEMLSVADADGSSDEYIKGWNDCLTIVRRCLGDVEGSSTADGGDEGV